MALRSLLAKDWVLEVDTRAPAASAPQWTRVNGLTSFSESCDDNTEDDGGAAALAFVVEPNRTYLFGVLAQMRVSHSLRRTDGKPIPQPSGTELTAYGLLRADVPAMYMSHVVLAK